MNRKFQVIGLAALLFIAFFAGDALASPVEMWFSSLPTEVRLNRVTTVEAGDILWVVVYDPDRNIDSTQPDVILATEIRVINPNTGAILNPAWLGEVKDPTVPPLPPEKRYHRLLWETGPNTNIFVLAEAIIIGARDNYKTHIMGGEAPDAREDMWIEGNWIYDPFAGGARGPVTGALGRFEDGDTLIGIYHSTRDPSDVAGAMVQLVRTKATIAWDKSHYTDIGGRAEITVVDLDENLNPDAREYVPIFIIVNPGTWNPVQLDPNHSPIAVDDHHTTPMNDVLTIAAPGVLANDFDPDGDQLTVELVTEPADGVLVLNPDGSFTYTPKLGFFGTDSFTYRATDIHGASDEATVWITVTHPDINHPPVAVDDAYAVYIGVVPLIIPYVQGVLLNDIDPDNDAVVEAVLVTDVPTGHTLDLRSDGSFTYTPLSGFTGTVSFTYRAVDARDGISAEATVTITVNPDPTFPNAVDDEWTVFIDHILTVLAPGVLGNDVFGDVQTVSQIVLVTKPAYGTVISPELDGSFTYTPLSGFTGTVSFTYRVYDDRVPRHHDEATVTITVIPLPTNIAPIATDDEYATLMDTVLTVPAALGVLANDSDSNDDPLTAELVTVPGHGVLVLNPDGSFTYTPNPGWHGIDSFTYRASDGRDGHDVATVTITVGVLRQQAQSRTSAANFQMLLRYGGVDKYGDPIITTDNPLTPNPIRWYNIFDGRYIMYPITALAPNWNRGFAFKIDPGAQPGPGVVSVRFLAKETGMDTGKFVLELDDIQARLGFTTLPSEYVLAALYVDPNDFSDVAIATAYAISAPDTSPDVHFADAEWARPEQFALGRDRVNVEVNYSPINRDLRKRDEVVVQIFSPHSADREWIILDEAGVNTSIFRARTGLGLQSVWDAAGAGFLDAGAPTVGNKYLDTFNRSAVIVRFNAVEVECYPTEPHTITAWHDHRRVAFAEMEITSDLVFDGEAGRLNMRFIDAVGEAVIGYTVGESVFIEIIDPDQNEDILRRDRISPRWGIPNLPGYNHRPFNPRWILGPDPDGLDPKDIHGDRESAVIFITNPRTGKWAPIEMWETDLNTNIFRSIEPVVLTALEARTGDTILAFFQDPSDHSDVAVISIRVVAVVNHPPVAVDDAYEMLMNTVLDTLALEIPGVLANDTDPDNDPLTAEVVTEPVYGVLVLNPDGSFIYTPDPGWHGIDSFVYRASDARGGITEATVTITVLEEEVVLDIDDFIVVHERSSRFSFVGTGVAETFRLTIFNMLGRKVVELTEFNVGPGDLVIWDGRDEDGVLLAKGPYIFVAVLTGADDVVFTIRGTVFRKN